MKHVQKLSFLFLLFVSSISLGQQIEANEVVDSNGPRATVRYKTARPEPSQLMIQLMELTDGDEVIVEKTIFTLQNLYSNPITKIVSDEEFKQIKADSKQTAISTTEVLKIINNHKTK